MPEAEAPDPREPVFDVDVYRPARRRRMVVALAAPVAAITVVRMAVGGLAPLPVLGMLLLCGLVVVLWAADVWLATLTLTTDAVRLQTLLRTRSLDWSEVATAWVPDWKSTRPSLRDREVQIQSLVIALVVMVLVAWAPRTPGPWNSLSAGIGAAGAFVGVRYAMRLAGRRHARSEGRTTGVVLYDEAGDELLWFPETIDPDDARRLRTRLKTLGVKVVTGPPEQTPSED